MELVELLDKIDETAPKSCQTCRHMATHKKCNDCLYGPERTWEQRNEPYEYRNWEPGNWLRDLQHAERMGNLHQTDGGCCGKRLAITVHTDRSHTVYWDILADGSYRLESIWRLDSSEKPVSRYWPHYDNNSEFTV